MKTLRVKCRACDGDGYVTVFDPDALRAKRQDADVSLREFARKLGFSAAYLSDIERGRRDCTPSIAEAYKNL